MYAKAVQYLVVSGVIGFVCYSFATPSEEELKKIENFGSKNKAFADVLKAAADPSSKPMYLQKPGQQHPIKTDEKK